MPLGYLNNITAKDIYTYSNSISALDNLHFAHYAFDLLKHIEEEKTWRKKKINKQKKPLKFFCYITPHITNV